MNIVKNPIKKRKNGSGWKGYTYLVCDFVTNTLNKISRSADESLQRSSKGSSASAIVELINESTMQIFIELLREMATKFGENVPDTEV